MSFEPADHKSATKLVLLVEDERQVRHLLSAALSKHGFDVVEAGDGLEALLLLQESRPDVVVTDIILPNLDGISVAQRAAALHLDIPVVFISGFADVTLSRLEDISIKWAFVPKPFPVAKLVETVRSVLETEEAA